MDSAAFWGVLKSWGLNFFPGVPDSNFGKAYNLMVQDLEIRYVPAIREDVTLGVASIAYFFGGLGRFIMQNSGIGNIVNSLTSFSLMYKIPALLGAGWRGHGGRPNDEPNLWIMGVKAPEILDLLEVPFRAVEPDYLESDLNSLLDQMTKEAVPGALIVRSGNIW